jgi:2-oxoglutarate dehydrogenase E1 component
MESRTAVLPLLLHGDAAFAGQGIVAEVLNMSQLPGYLTGGTLHIVINNQIGFTTLPAEARSTFYATDVAKMIEAPVFHVNGDDPLAVAFVAEVALEFRQKFHRDVVIDLYCYRRHGHNEGDEPVYTQPDLYAIIEAHPSTATQFRRQLVEDGVLAEEQAAAIEQELDARMTGALAEVKEAEAAKKKLTIFEGAMADFQPAYFHEPADTAITRGQLEEVVKALTTVPENLNLLPKTRRVVIEPKLKAFQNGGPYDWACAEALAFGSLLTEGTPVRLSGQDCRRGTFSQRHAALFDAKTHEAYIPLNHIRDGQPRFCIYNSLLSEAAVLGFDYGYSLGYPEMLCLWEAQFGDFANGAQVITDQFISCAESKWQRLSGLVMLLPHGYEGQGPEHSSARIERFLQLCAEDNIQVANLTTPAQLFHILRRQMKRKFRKPLVIATPKSLLRHPRCVSVEADFTGGRFHEILPGPAPAKPGDTTRAILCCGKVYYDLLAHLEEKAVADTALIRVEQLYPLHTDALHAALAPFKKLKTVVWCQEEPQNMGAWSFIEPRLRALLGRDIVFAGRDAAASPAVGALAIHKREQKQLVEDAFRALQGRPS